MTVPPSVRTTGTQVQVLSVGRQSQSEEGVTTALERRDEQFTVETVATAEEAMDQLETGRFDCVVSAQELPDLTGVELLETVRGTSPQLPFILFTANGSEAIASDALSAGATDYVRKDGADDPHDRLADRIGDAVREYRTGRVEQRLVEIAEHTDRIFFAFSRDWTELLFISPTYEEIWGRSIEDLHEDPLDFLRGIHPDDRDRCRDAMERVWSGERIDVEFRVNADEQYRRRIRVRGEPIVDASGAVVQVAGFGIDVTEEHLRQQRRERQRGTLIDLATDDAVTNGDLETALQRITETAAEVLAVSRVNVWLVEDDGGTLTCIDNYDQSTGEHTSDMALEPDQYPTYIDALETHRAIDARDAHADPRTAELAEYLDQHGIGALLDGTLRSEGEVIGVICHEHVGGPREWTDDEIEFVSTVADVVHRALRNHQRTQRERELRREREQFERLLDTSPVGITLLDADGVIQRANDRAEEIFELESSEIAGLAYDEKAWDALDENGDPVPDEQLPFTKVMETGEPVYNVEHGIRTGSGKRRWLSINATPLPGASDEEQGVLAVVKDVTERHREQERLRTLHERSQAMARTGDREAIAGIAVETVDELLGHDGAVVYEFDGAERLVPLEWSAGIGSDGEEPPAATRGDDVRWTVFADGEEQFVDTFGDDGRGPGDLPFASAFVLPVDTHGVLVTGTNAQGGLTGTERKVAHLLRDNLAAALDRADREQRLREHDRRLQRQNDRLQQLNRLNRIIRETTAAIIQSASQMEVERSVCEEIAAGEEYAFAWMGSRDAVDGALEVSQRAEMDPEYLEYLESVGEPTPLHAMVEEAYRTGSVQVAGRILERSDWKDHRRDVLNQGYRSVAVVPVTMEGRVDGVLVIHGTGGDLFDDREQAVLAELGEAIGYALGNVDRGRAVESEQHTEIELAIADERLFANQIAAALGVDVTLVGAIPGDGDAMRTFLRLADPPEEGGTERLRSLRPVTDVEVLSLEETGGLYQVTLETPQLVRSVHANGVQLRALSAGNGTTTITAVLPGETPVRSFVEELQVAYPETELTARRERVEPVDTPETFREQLIEELTDKQFDALQTALYGGFYEWPRSCTREELAATRDIASSTFSHHLRAAERKLVSAVLDSL